jgi:hypothetical protein
MVEQMVRLPVAVVVVVVLLVTPALPVMLKVESQHLFIGAVVLFLIILAVVAVVLIPVVEPLLVEMLNLVVVAVVAQT